MITMMDTIRTNAHNIPQSCQKVAGYVTGSGSVPWTDAEWALFPHAAHVMINQAPGSAQPFIGVVKDVEAEAGSITDFVNEARIRWEQRKWNYCAYIDAADVNALANACRAAGLTDSVQLWVADWRLNQDGATAQLGTTVNGYRIVAVQWASPSSNPDTLVPGSSLTLKQANIDLSVTEDAWFAPPAPPTPPPVHDTVTAKMTLKVGGTQVQFPITSTDGGQNWTG